jgi:acetylornithine deacetylase
VQGVAAHAAFRLEGESAIDRYLPLHANLHALERERNTGVEHTLMRELDLPYPILIGRLDAGEWSSMVPDRLRFEGRVGVRVGEPPAEARAAVEQLAAGVAELTWEGGAFASGEIAADHPLTVLVRAAAADVLGSEPPLRGVPYGADMRLFTQQGIPCLIVGPGDPHGAHTVDESIGVAELELGARVLALATVRYLGVRA